MLFGKTPDAVVVVCNAKSGINSKKLIYGFKTAAFCLNLGLAFVFLNFLPKINKRLLYSMGGQLSFAG